MYALSCNIYISWVRIFVRMKFRMPLFVIILLTFRHKLSSRSHLQRLGFYGGTTLHALSMVLELIYLMAIFVSTLDYLFFYASFLATSTSSLISSMHSSSSSTISSCRMQIQTWAVGTFIVVHHHTFPCIL